MSRSIKTPGPDHPIDIDPAGGVYEAVCSGRVIARSERALLLREASSPPVVYFPREDVTMAMFDRSSTSTWCPYKGEASYVTLRAAGENASAIADAGWSYETPLPAMSQIAGHIAFYPSKVTVRAV